jgi:quercetin dioxygenase-like cupin family protein
VKTARQLHRIGTTVITLIARGPETGGAVSLLEFHDQPGAGPPLHVHHREGEGFYVLEGEYEFQLGEESRRASRGDFFFAPANLPHSYKVTGAEPGRLLISLHPAGGEGYFLDSAAVAEEDPERWAKYKAIAERYEIFLLKPSAAWEERKEKDKLA